jgi:hypothetical protein
MLKTIIILSIISVCLGLSSTSASLAQDSVGSADSLWPSGSVSPNDAKVIDPRNRCNDCTRPAATKPVTRFALPGLWGRPYVEPHVGDCQCGSCTGVPRHPGKSAFWPRPLSGYLENDAPRLNSFLEDCFAPALTAPFDRLGDFRGLPYQRRDSGYAGCGRDPYGCLGESNQSGNCR